MQEATTFQSGEPNPLDSTGLCLLSLDGGGVRGLSTLYILKGLMDRLNRKQPQGAPAKKPCEVFDLIGGTSTGGLIAIMLGRLEMDVDECITAYVQLMKDIFKNPSKWNVAASLFGDIRPRFDASKLEDAINEVISNCGANPTDLFNDQTKRGCRVFVCSIAQQTKSIVRLRSYPGPNNLDIPATICQAARATSAATTYFEPVAIGARIFADGALGANNPVDEVEGEASNIWCPETGDLKPLVKCFISIGTGNPGKKALEDNLLKFMSKTLSELATETEQTEKNFIARWRQHYDSKRYYRFNVEQGLQNVGLAEFQEQGLIEAATEEYLDHQAVTFQVRDCIQNLESKQNETDLQFAMVAREYQKKAILLEQWSGRARWHVPFEQNPNFTGRKVLFENLKQRLEQKSHSTKKMAIIGLGGVGKTQLVLELAHQVREQCAVFWIPVNTLANLQTKYQEIAQSLHLPGYEKNGAHVLEAVQKYLSDESIGPWLLIFDNADNVDMWTEPFITDTGNKRLIDYMPRSRHGAIIWTTRDRKVATTVARENTVAVPALDEAGASEMIRNYLINPHLTTASESTFSCLLRKLTCLPLAIVQAAAYINDTGISLAEYEVLLFQQDDEVIELLSEEFEDDSRYPGSENAVAKTWLISFEQICRRSSLAFDYLRLMACVDPKDIPKSLLPLPETSSRKQQIDAIGILDAFSFITRHESGLAFDMHRLVHLATRGWLKNNGELSPCHQKAVVRLNELLSDVRQTNRMVWRVYIAHAQYAVTGGSNNSDDVIDLAKKCGDCLNYDGRYCEAEIMFQKVFQHREKVLGSEHPDTFTSIDNLGHVLSKQGKYKEAEAMHRRALKGCETVLGREHPSTLINVNDLGSVLSNQGKYEEAETMHRRALRDRKEILGPEHPETLTSVNNLGLALDRQGKYEEAEALYRQALRDEEKVLGPEHLSTLTSLSNLGDVLDNQGKYGEGEAMHRRALRDREKVLGSEHPDTLTSVSNLAKVLDSQGIYEEAEAMHRRVLKGCEKVLGREHPSTLVSVNNLGHVLSNQGKYEEAETMHRRALRDQKEVLGPEHPETLASINNLGYVLSSQINYKEAEALYRQALKGYKKVLGLKHPDTLTSVSNLGDVLNNQGKYEEAEAMYRQALRNREKILGPEHLYTLASVNNLGLVLSNQGRYEEAEAMHRRALRGKEKVLGPEHPNTLTSVGNLGLVLSSQGKYEEAEALYRRALRDREKILGPEHPETLTSVNNLGHVFDSQGKYEEAEGMHRRALRDKEKVLGPEHPNTLISVSNLGKVLDRQGKYKEAEAMHRRALRDLERMLGPEHPDTLTSVNNLGYVLSNQGKYEEAETMHRRDLEGLEKVLGPEHPDTLTSVSNLGKVLDRQGKYEEAEAMRRRALEGYGKVHMHNQENEPSYIPGSFNVLDYRCLLGNIHPLISALRADHASASDNRDID